MTPARPYRLVYWCAIAAWLVVIWHFGSSQVLPTSSVDVVRWLIRKQLHLLVYAILGALLMLAFGPRQQWNRVMGLCLAVALGDELHQAFVPLRSFKVHDVMIDLVGGTVGAGVTGVLTTYAHAWWNPRP